jgi:hypothetical protein
MANPQLAIDNAARSSAAPSARRRDAFGELDWIDLAIACPSHSRRRRRSLVVQGEERRGIRQ